MLALSALSEIISKLEEMWEKKVRMRMRVEYFFFVS